MSNNKTIKIPFTITLTTGKNGNLTINDSIDYYPEPFETRESLTSTLRSKVLSHLMHRATVEFDEKTLDSAISACDNRLMEPPDLPDYPEYETLRLNSTEPNWRDYPDEYTDDEADEWLNEHYRLRDSYSYDSTEYDTEALIKTVLLYANEGSY